MWDRMAFNLLIKINNHRVIFCLNAIFFFFFFLYVVKIGIFFSFSTFCLNLTSLISILMTSAQPYEVS